MRTPDSGVPANEFSAMGLSVLPAALSDSAADPQQGASRTSEVRVITFVPLDMQNGCLKASPLDAQAVFVRAHSSCSPIL